MQASDLSGATNSKRCYAPLLQAWMRHVFKRTLKAAKLPTAIRLYDARHSCATALIAAGINSKVVSERLGHSNVTITLQTYTHVSQELQKQASEEIDKAVSG